MKTLIKNKQISKKPEIPYIFKSFYDFFSETCSEIKAEESISKETQVIIGQLQAGIKDYVNLMSDTLASKIAEGSSDVRREFEEWVDSVKKIQKAK